MLLAMLQRNCDALAGHTMKLHDMLARPQTITGASDHDGHPSACQQLPALSEWMQFYSQEELMAVDAGCSIFFPGQNWPGNVRSGSSCALVCISLTSSLSPSRLPQLVSKREPPAADSSAAVPKRARDKRVSPHPATDAHSSRIAACDDAHDGAVPVPGESTGFFNWGTSPSRRMLPSAPSPPRRVASGSLSLENTIHADADASVNNTAAGSANSAPVVDVRLLCLPRSSAHTS